jgi:hypothetical protein
MSTETKLAGNRTFSETFLASHVHRGVELFASEQKNELLFGAEDTTADGKTRWP